MSTFRVVWAVQIDADSPEEAAEAAREMQLDESSLATLFNVVKVADGSPIGPRVLYDCATSDNPTVH